MFSYNLKGFILAVVSSAFIGSSFIIKKKGLRRAAANGRPAGVGGYGYLLEPLWWVGMITMIVGEVANFVAYIYAPAVLVTPLGALSIIVSAVLAHFLLNEKLRKMGILGCLLCIVGSTIIVLHAPQERPITSVLEIWELATQTGILLRFDSFIQCSVSWLHESQGIFFPDQYFLLAYSFPLYTASAVAVSLVLILYCAPRCGQTNVFVYVGICSVIGSLTVMSVKAIGTAIKLTLEGRNQAVYFQTWIFAMVAVTCVIIQLNYLNMALDTFNTAVVSPIYYALFTSFTILASAIMFKDYNGQSASSIASELCGFITVLSGTTVLHSTREPDPPANIDLYTPLSPKVKRYVQGNGEPWKQKEEDGAPFNLITIVRQDHFK
ncbi:probable magnesium transporter NIPA7 [Prosopis cineraria]|uniref:probable magnesium transporter NIPA7 n=1 Tax=Prosopis cineraria TaxID=364024 RepID=UPI00240EDFD5|nr:probable magnesium transporter NIPA7 [Prosopis cineraria]